MHRNTQTIAEYQRLVNEHEKVISKLQHDHRLEKEKLEHRLTQAFERFEVEKEKLIHQTKTELLGDREKFIERNNDDAKDFLKNNAGMAQKMINAMISIIPNAKTPLLEGGDADGVAKKSKSKKKKERKK